LSGFNLGDALYQLFSLAFIVLIIALIVSLFRNNKKRKNQLDRIEKKIDDMNQGINESDK
jgi:cbb3-type cytochrome oxidase subunit 3